MKDILNKLASNHLSTYVSIILMFTYTILSNRDFACACKPQVLNCNSYLFLPFSIVFLLTLWTNGGFLKVCRYTLCCSEGCSKKCCSKKCCSKKCCSKKCCSKKCCCFLIFASLKVVEAVSVGLLWVVFVLVDGDWYVCCRNNGSDAQVVLACKAKENITKDERAMISELKNNSRNIAGVLLLGIIFVGFLFKLLVRSKCCNRKFVYDKLILEEEGKVLKEVLRKSATDQLKNKVQTKIQERRFEECFNVAEELIKELTPPDARGQAGRQEQTKQKT
ncbi:uncharacterized protein [Labrus bergylta]|uniref:uncharacterized protein isoform X1 n=1 Tax=Labrus bergylta TaxID=56723 RepID=UPI003313C105